MVYSTLLKNKYLTGGKVYVAPIIVGDKLYVGSNDHYLYSLDKADLAFNWKYDTGDGIICPASVSNDNTIVYVGNNNGYLSAIYAASGLLYWNYRVDPPGSGLAWAIYSKPMIDSSGLIYFSSNNSYAYCLYPDGTLKWKHLLIYDVTHLGGSWSVILSNDESILYCNNATGSVFALNTSDGSEAWVYHIPDWVYHDPVGISVLNIDSDGVIYSGFDDFYMYAINPNGTLKWRYKTGGNLHWGGATLSDSRVYFGSDDTYLYALNKDGTLIWKYSVQAQILSTPLIIGDNLFFTSWAGFVFSIDKDTKPRWIFFSNVWALYSDVVASGNFYYFGAQNKNIYQLEETVLSSKSGMSLTAPNTYNQPPWEPPKKGGSSALLLFAKMLMG